MFSQATINQTHYLQVFVTDNNGNGINGLSINYKIIKSKGGLIFKQGTLIEDTNHNGVYVAGVTFTTLGYYRVLYNAPVGYYDEIETIKVVTY